MSMVPCRPYSILQKVKMSATASRSLNAGEAVIANPAVMSADDPRRASKCVSLIPLMVVTPILRFHCRLPPLAPSRRHGDQIHFNGNLQSLLAAFRRPRTGQKTYPHSNDTVHGQLSQSPLRRIEVADKPQRKCCYCIRPHHRARPSPSRQARSDFSGTDERSDRRDEKRSDPRDENGPRLTRHRREP